MFKTINRTGNTRSTDNKIHTYSSWEYVYFPHVKTIQSLLIQAIEQSEVEDDFDVDFIKSNAFMLQFLKFIYDNSSRKVNKDFFKIMETKEHNSNEELYSKYFFWLLNKEDDEDDTEKEKQEKDENSEDEIDFENNLSENEIIFTLYNIMKCYINYNNLYIFETGNALKLFRFFVELKHN